MVLVQSLFAQLCAPLDHVGQHFRDCVSAAEDLRDLETLKRVLLTTKKDDKNSRIGEKKNKNHDIQIIENDQIKKKLETHHLDLKNKMIPKVFRQFGGHTAWLKYPSRLELKNLIFSYSSPATINLNSIDIRPILNNISFSIPPGGYSLGIVGPSGKKISQIFLLNNFQQF